MFNAADYRRAYKRQLGPLAQAVTLMINNGTGWTSYPGVMAHVSNWQERDLIAGGTVKTGDLRLIILAESLPDGVERLEQKDRIQIGSRAYSVINWDGFTRSIGDATIAVEVTVRG